jgi:hypothetical protein
MCHMCHKLISFYSVMFLDLFLYASFFVYVNVSPLFSLCIYSFSLMLLSLSCACFSPTLCLSKWLLFPLAYFLLRSWLLFHAFFFVSMTLYLCFFVCMSTYVNVLHAYFLPFVTVFLSWSLSMHLNWFLCCILLLSMFLFSSANVRSLSHSVSLFVINVINVTVRYLSVYIALCLCQCYTLFLYTFVSLLINYFHYLSLYVSVFFKLILLFIFYLPFYLN